MYKHDALQFIAGLSVAGALISTAYRVNGSKGVRAVLLAAALCLLLVVMYLFANFWD
jgi:hypothetical protein